MAFLRREPIFPSFRRRPESRTRALVEYFTGVATATNPGLSIWQAGYSDLTNVIFGNNTRCR